MKQMNSLTNIYVDADASPVKNEVIRVARRYGLKVYLVSNSNSSMRIPRYQLVERVVVTDRMDAADDWIVEHITGNDVVVSADIPLLRGASRWEPASWTLMAVFSRKNLSEMPFRTEIL